jgi:hypothetical protein
MGRKRRGQEKAAGAVDVQQEINCLEKLKYGNFNIQDSNVSYPYSQLE